MSESNSDSKEGKSFEIGTLVRNADINSHSIDHEEVSKLLFLHHNKYIPLSISSTGKDIQDNGIENIIKTTLF